ncbi:MAG: efflux RND transporter periplasmic adaptor subunit [Muribaculaceae bacterium]|nr:efflux RND transporter periplasmic adaptor subunit [Muribaculaceae bacterium]
MPASAFFKKKTTRVCLAAIIVVGIVITLYLILRRPAPREVERPTVEVTRVSKHDVNIYGEFAGRIRAQQFVEVRARVEGYLQSMNFREGSHVDKGDLLFIIDPTIYRAHAEKANATLQKAKAVALKAERDLARIRPLFAQNAASQLDLDNAEAAYESAKADVAVAEADLKQANQTLSYTRVTAPTSGYISETGADIGTLVGSGAKSLLATIVKSDTVRIDFSMTALDYLRSKERNVNLGSEDGNLDWDPYVTINLADGTEYPHRGLLDFASPQVDPKTGTFSVRAEMPNPDHALLPGEFTKVKLLLDVRTNAIEIPSKALEVEKGAAYVYVVLPDSVVERRFVETGPEVGNNVVIERGLSAGENIVTEGYHKLRHGMKVLPVTASTAASSETEVR